MKNLWKNYQKNATYVNEIRFEDLFGPLNFITFILQLYYPKSIKVFYKKLSLHIKNKEYTLLKVTYTLVLLTKKFIYYKIIKKIEELYEQ